MTTAEFLEELQDVLQCEDPINIDDCLGDMEEWDSMATMAFMAFIDKKFAIQETFSAIGKSKTVADLITLCQGQVK